MTSATGSVSVARQLVGELARTRAGLPHAELRRAGDRVADALAVLRTVGGDERVDATIRDLTGVRDRLRTADAGLSAAVGELEHYALHAVGMPLPPGPGDGGPDDHRPDGDGLAG